MTLAAAAQSTTWTFVDGNWHEGNVALIGPRSHAMWLGSSVFDGGRTPDGKPFYAPFPFDPGLAADNWATWKFTNSVALDPLSVGTVFTAPPAAPVSDTAQQYCSLPETGRQ